MFSDDGTNLVGAVKILRECINKWNQQQIQDFLLKRDIQWTFMPPTASHMGRAWDRQIRPVRRMLISIADDQCLPDDQLHTFLLEAESIMNSRPLIPITLDVDSHEALTPNHLLKLHPAVELPPILTTAMLEVDGDMCSTWLTSFGADFPRNICIKLRLVRRGTRRNQT